MKNLYFFTPKAPLSYFKPPDGPLGLSGGWLWKVFPQQMLAYTTIIVGHISSSVF